jgi:hypothetical protein
MIQKTILSDLTLCAQFASHQCYNGDIVAIDGSMLTSVATFFVGFVIFWLGLSHFSEMVIFWFDKTWLGWSHFGWNGYILGGMVIFWLGWPQFAGIVICWLG